MIWYKPKDNEERLVSKFLLFPKTINGTTRWLEKVTFLQYYFLPVSGSGWWRNKEWVK